MKHVVLGAHDLLSGPEVGVLRLVAVKSLGVERVDFPNADCNTGLVHLLLI